MQAIEPRLAASNAPERCDACGNTNPAYLKECPRCHGSKCDVCDMGDDVECPGCDFDDAA